jgi:hypothetical protein
MEEFTQSNVVCHHSQILLTIVIVSLDLLCKQMEHVLAMEPIKTNTKDVLAKMDIKILVELVLFVVELVIPA